MMLDDTWLQANPSKTPADLPDRRSALRKSRANYAAGTSECNDDVTHVNVATIVNDHSFLYSGPLVAPATLPATPSQPPVTPPARHSHAPATPAVQASAQLTCRVALDSGATTTCWKTQYGTSPLATPIDVEGASGKNHLRVTSTAELPCPALRGGGLKGLYSPHFNHNLIGVSALQRKGVDIHFPAWQAYADCKDSATGEVLWRFHRHGQGLYEADLHVPAATPTAKVAATTCCQCDTLPITHPAMLHHYRLGHMGEGTMKLLCKQGLKGLPEHLPAPPQSLHNSCLPCIESKTQAAPHPPLAVRASGPLVKIHADLVGPNPVSLRGERYRLTIVDDWSRHGWTILLHTKDQAKQRILEWIAFAENHTRRKLQHFHGDRGGEFLNKLLLQHFRAEGVGYSFSNPDSPQQNGVAEARNKSTGRILRALLNQSEAPRSLWGYAVQHATLLANLFPHGLLDGCTPAEMWSGRKPDLRRLRVWGCTAHVLQNKDQRRLTGGKLGPVTKPCVFVGLNPHGAGWLMLDGATNREIPSSDVVFQEDTPYYRRKVDREEDAPTDWTLFDFADEDQPPAPVAGLPPPPAGAPPVATLPPVAPSRLDPIPEEPTAALPSPSPAAASPPAAGRRSRRLQGLEPEVVPPSNLRFSSLPNAGVVTPTELPTLCKILMQTL